MEKKQKSKTTDSGDSQWNKCSLEQLNQACQRVQQEYKFYQSSLEAFQALSKECSKNEDVGRRLKAASIGNKVLLPLTGTMYVEGRLLDPFHLLVNIGADYYAKMTNDQVVDFYRRKISLLSQKAIELRSLLEQSKATKLQIMSALNAKQEEIESR